MSFKIIYGGDHRGIPLKKVLILHAKITQKSFQDIGINMGSLLDYVDVSKRMAEEMFFQSNVIGVSVCRHGYAFAAALNRFPHVRAFTCTTVKDAIYVREKLNANALCFGNDTISSDLACEIIDAFLRTPFVEGKHLHCVEKLSKLGQPLSFKPIVKVSLILTWNHQILLCQAENNDNSERRMKYCLPNIESLPLQSLIQTLTDFFSPELQPMVQRAQFIGVFEHGSRVNGQLFHEVHQMFYLELSEKPSDIFSELYFFLKTKWLPFKNFDEVLFVSQRLKAFIKKIIEKESAFMPLLNDFELET